MANQQRLLKSGFTILELLLVIVIIGTIAGIALLSYSGITSKAIGSALQSDLTNANIYLKLYHAENDVYPATLSLVNNGNGVSSTVGNTYSYNVSANGKQYCIASSNGTAAYYIVNGSAPAAGGCVNLDSLVLYLDAGNPTSYIGSGTSWQDLTGSGTIATAYSGVSFDKNKGGGAMVFSGGNYIDTNYLIASNDFSVTIAFAYTGGVTASWRILWASDYWSDSSGYIGRIDTGSPSSASFQAANFTDSVFGASMTGIITSNFHIYTFVKTNGGTKKIYVDGNLAASGNINDQPIRKTIYLGCRHGNTGGGTTDCTASNTSQFLVYSRALSASEVSQNFNALRNRYGL